MLVPFCFTFSSDKGPGARGYHPHHEQRFRHHLGLRRVEARCRFHCIQTQKSTQGKLLKNDRETLGCSTFFISINVLFDSDYVRQ